MRTIESRTTKTKGKVYFVRYRYQGRSSSQVFDAGTDRQRQAEAQKFARLLDAHEDAQAALDAMYGPAVAGEPARVVPTLDEVAAAHIANLERADASHKLKQQRMWDRVWAPRLGALPADSVDRAACVRALGDLAENGLAPGRGYKEKTLKHQRALLYGVLERAVDEGYLPTNPGRKLYILPTTSDPDEDYADDHERAYLEHDEFEIVLAAFPELYRPLVLFLAFTGARWGEAIELRVRDLDLRAGTIRIRRAYKPSPDGQGKVGKPKTKRSVRTVSLDPALVAELRQLVNGKHADDLLFTAERGGRIKHSVFWADIWRPALWRARRCPEHRGPEPLKRGAGRPAKGAPVPCLCGTAHPERCKIHLGEIVGPCGCEGTLTKTPRIHDLRHTHASWLIGAGVDIVVVSRRLGHESITTTIDLYTHLLDDGQDAAVEALAGIRAAMQKPALRVVG